MRTVLEMFQELKKHEWVELSHELYPDSPHWSGFPDDAFQLNQVLIDWQELDGFEFQVMTQKFVGQFGTHIDAPNHFIRNGGGIGIFGVKDLCLPLCVIDLTEKVKETIDYAIQMSDIEEYEKKYGKIEAGSFVAIRTDWSKRWPDMDQMSMTDENGQDHFPGWSLEPLKFLVEERGVVAIGHETLDTDAALEIAKNGDFCSERYILSQNKFQIEGLKNLDQVPAKGAVIFIGVPRIMDACGMPVRAWAICPKE